MKTKFGFISLPVALVALYIVGPSVDINYKLETVTLPDNIDRYLEESESQFSDIVEGAEKKIVWNKPQSPEVTPYSIVYLHGFSASRQEIAPLCDKLSKQLSANLYYTRLTGHGRSSDAMQQVSVNALVNDANEALQIGKRIGNKVILIGTSTGGSLATWLAGHSNDKTISAMVLLSPNFGLKRTESEIMLYPWGEMILHLVEGEEYHFSSTNELHEKYWTTRYPSSALLSMMGIVELSRKINFAQIEIPTMVLYSEQDEIVNTLEIKQRFSQLGSTKKAIVPVNDTLDPNHHVLAGNILSPNTTDSLVEQIGKFLTTTVQ